MKAKGTFYKDIFELKELGKNECQIIYTPYSYLTSKTRNELGTGVACYKDKKIAAEHEIIHPELNERFIINKKIEESEIPSDKYFFEAEKPLSEQNEYIKNCIFDSYSLQVLFQFEFRRLNTVLDRKILEEKIPDAKTFLTEEYQKFYDEKKEILLKLKDGKEFVNFITEQTETNSRDIASAFICWTGIYGMKAGCELYDFDYLLYDFSEHSLPTGIKLFNQDTLEEIEW